MEYEFIIIDGNSTDGSVDIIKQYEDKVDYWISAPDSGIYNAMNKEIKTATAEYCLFINSGDCFCHDNVLKEIFLHDLNGDIICGNALFENYCEPNDVVMLKIDTQGFEKNVLEGARKSLEKITILQLEMSIEPLYEKEILFVEMVNLLQQIGFELFTLENGIRNSLNGKLLQVDGIFINKHKVK